MSSFRNKERVRMMKLGQAGLVPRLNGNPQKMVFGDGSVGDADDGQVIGGFTIGANSISAGTGNGTIALEVDGTTASLFAGDRVTAGVAYSLVYNFGIIGQRNSAAGGFDLRVADPVDSGTLSGSLQLFDTTGTKYVTLRSKVGSVEASDLFICGGDDGYTGTIDLSTANTIVVKGGIITAVT